MGFKLNSLHLSKDLIKKCYAAEVVSQELNRGAEEQEGKYYGRVYVKKRLVQIRLLMKQYLLLMFLTKK